VDMDSKVTEFLQEILFDPQTSGGLLIAVPQKKAQTLLKRLYEEGVNEAVEIGEVVAELIAKITVI
jgi:selenide, water dikinase